MARTRAINSQWEENNAIGIYMKQGGEDLTTHILSDARNIKYVTPSGDGSFEVETADQAILYPKNGQSVDFIAYHPFQTVIQSYNYKIDVSDQQNQANIDFLYSDNAKNLSASQSSAVGLVFSHQLTKILINVLPGGAVTDLTGVEVVAKGMLTKADFHLGTTALTYDITSEGSIVFNTQPQETGILAEAIILPIPSNSGRVVTFTLAGKIYTWSIPDGTEFVAGKRYTYNATLSEKEVVIINPNGNIVDWDEIPSGDIEAEFKDTPPSILINQTNDALSGLEVGTSILLKGSITSIVDLVSAKIISVTSDGIETEIDLLASAFRSSKLTLDFEETIIATFDLATIRIEAEDKNLQKTSHELKVKVGFYSYTFLASGSGFTTFPEYVKPFLSASLGKSLSFCEAKDLSTSTEAGSSPIEVGFSTFNAPANNIAIANMANINAGKFKHPTCSPSYAPFWGSKTIVYISKATDITRSNFGEVTVAQLKGETALTSGEVATSYLTEGTGNTILDVAYLYQVKIDGEYKRVVFCLDKIEDKLGTSEVLFWVNMIVEK